MSADDPNRCARVAAHLSAFVDEELGLRERRAVALHLARCGGCRAERDALLALGRVAREAPLASPAIGLAARVRGSGSARPAPRPRRVAAAAALALLGASALAGAYLLGRAHGAAIGEGPSSPDVSPGDSAPAEAPGRSGEDGGRERGTRDRRAQQDLGGGPLLSPR